RINRRNILFDHDPLGHLNNLLFTEREEDVNGDGELSPEEDTDHDGVWDRPNFMEPDGCAAFDNGSTEYDRCVADQLVTFYDRQDDTLILRPLWPMEERCTHAMVLTKRLLGEDGEAVQSPFQAVHAATQERALRPMVGLLDRYGLSASDIAFAWSFTTGTMTKDLDTLRDGLYGHGPFSRLADEFPTDIRWIPSVHEAADGGLVEPGGCAGITLTTIWANELVGIGEWLPNMCSMGADYNGVGGLAWGWFEAPNLMVDRDGLAHDAEDLFQSAEDLLEAGEVEKGLEVLADAHREWLPADSDERWEMNAHTGEATYGRTRVPIWCAIPRDRAVDTCVDGNPDRAPFCKPYPTVLFSHGYTGSRQGMQDFLGRTTSMGYVACATDAYGHGKNLYLQTGETEVYDIAIEDYYGYGTAGMAEMMLMGRDRDLNND
ncbi:MAG: hypothetical protein VX938_02595, partial [Myxococcota bacterium]|nr:hypothetical protein [Myxococcota bacterium]